MFEGRRLLVATNHGKEQVIAPILERVLGVHCLVDDSFNTDQFGTFTGEMERNDNALDTVRNKCRKAMEHTGLDLVVASEGSFGAHPTIFFAKLNEELLLLVDAKNGLEISVREWSLETNFDGQQVASLAELFEFVNRVQFPSHALILRKSATDMQEIEKGILDWAKLGESFLYFMQQFGSVYVETDMRAMCNPSRMRVIEKTTFQLVEKIQSLCPTCAAPGFGCVGATPGLPCEMCNMPTNSVLSLTYSCLKCGETSEKKYPNDKRYEDPTYCNWCNP